MISVRIVNVDYYMCYPTRDLDVIYSEFRGAEVRQVPVIQIYGTSREGHKTCVNVHGVFPYVYIPYDGTEPAGKLSYKIAAELDKALNISLGQASSSTHHVHNIVLVSGMPLYGYHERQHQFLKIYFYNPAIIKKACSLLENGAVLGKCFQPHESHINSILQFMIDYNLHGMSFVNISRAMYRVDPENRELLNDIPQDLILPNDIQRRTICKFEIDVQASSITNRDGISTGKLAVNPGIAALWEDEKQRRRDQNKESQISFCLTQERNEVTPTKTHTYFENILAEKLSREFISDESSLDLNNSVYPAETPEENEFLNASAADHSILDTTVLDETIKESQNETLSEDDAKLLQILQDLKEEAARAEEDSILSQQLKPEESESLDEDDHNLSLSLKNVPDDDSVWENSFWDKNNELPSQIYQLDGVCDTDTNDSFHSDVCLFDEEPLIYKKEQDFSKISELTSKNNYRKASEVYICNDYCDIPMEKKLNPGMNKLILTQRKLEPTCEIVILSDVCIQSPSGNIKHEPLCILDNSSNNQVAMDDSVNEVIINDVNLGNVSPASPSTWDNVLISDYITSSPVSKNHISSFGNFLDELLIDEVDNGLNNSFNKENTLIEQKRDENSGKNKSMIKDTVSGRLTRSMIVTNNTIKKTEATSENIKQEETVVKNCRKNHRKSPNFGTVFEKSRENNRKSLKKEDISDQENIVEIDSQYNLRSRQHETFTEKEKQCRFCPGSWKVDNRLPKKKPTLKVEEKIKISTPDVKEERLKIEFNEEIIDWTYGYNLNSLSKQCITDCKSVLKNEEKIEIATPNTEDRLNIEFNEKIMDGYSLNLLSKQFTTDCHLFSPERDKIFDTSSLDEFLIFPQNKNETNNIENCAAGSTSLPELDIFERGKQEDNTTSLPLLNNLLKERNNNADNYVDTTTPLKNQNENNENFTTNTATLPDFYILELSKGLQMLNTIQEPKQKNNKVANLSASTLSELCFSPEEVNDNKENNPDSDVTSTEINTLHNKKHEDKIEGYFTSNVSTLLNPNNLSKEENNVENYAAFDTPPLSALYISQEKKQRYKIEENSTANASALPDLNILLEEANCSIENCAVSNTVPLPQLNILQENNNDINFSGNTTASLNLNILQEITNNVQNCAVMLNTFSHNEMQEKKIQGNFITSASILRDIDFSQEATSNEENSADIIASIELNMPQNDEQEGKNKGSQNSNNKKIDNATNNYSKEMFELLKIKIRNWHLDGQADSTTSDSNSTSSQDEELPRKFEELKTISPKRTCTELSNKLMCRVSGLSKPTVKKVNRKKNNESKKESTEIAKLLENLPEIKVRRCRSTENKEKILQEKESVVIKNGNGKTVKKREKSLLKLKTNSNSEQLEEQKLSESNSVSREIIKKKLQVVLNPLDTTLYKNYNSLSKNIENVEANTDTMKSLPNRNGKRPPRKKSAKLLSKNCTTSCSSSESLDFEQPDKRAKTKEMDNKDSCRFLAKTYENSNSHSTCAILSSDDALETNEFENRNISKRLRERPRKHIAKSNEKTKERKSKSERKYKLPTKRTGHNSVTKQIIEEAENTSLSPNLLDTNSSANCLKKTEYVEQTTSRVTRSSSSLSSSNNSSNGSKFNLIERRRKVNLRQEIFEEKSPTCISSGTSVKLSSQEQNSEANLRYSVKQNTITDNTLNIEVKLVTENKIKLPHQIKNKALALISKNAVVRLERLSTELLNLTKSERNKNGEIPNDSSMPLEEKQETVKNEKLYNKSPEKLQVRNGVQTEKSFKKTNSLNKSPRTATKKKSNILSARYSPLKIIAQSPKKQSTFVQTPNNNDYEPIIKRLRSNLQGIEPIVKTNGNSNTNGKENLKIIRGIGESSNLAVLQKEVETTEENIKKTLPKDCDIIDKSNNSPHSIRKRLFNLEDKLNATVYDEFKSCSYEKLSTPNESSFDDVNRDINYLRRLREKEEIFLQSVDSHYNTKNCDLTNLTSQKNQTEQEGNISCTALTNKSIKFPEIEIHPVKASNTKNSNTIIKIKTNLIQQENKNSKLNNKNTKDNISKPKSVKKKDKKPVTPIKSKDVYYLDITPEKHFYSPRETLSQQGDKELCNIDKYNTKINNLTVAEKYDLKRDFAPQPGSSKLIDEVPTSQTSSNFSFSYCDISLIDNSLMLNDSQGLETSAQNLSELDTTNVNNSNIWMPKYYPPSKSDVKNTLSNYNIPEYRYQQPFYSKYSDITGKVDIGHNVLKIPSTTTADLDEFESSNGFIGIEKWRKENFKSLYPTEETCINLRVTLAGHSKIIITPVISPPSRKEVLTWLKNKINESEERTVQKVEKPRITILLSPGNSNDSFNESMTLSPCTPEIISPPLSQNIIESSQITPVSSLNSTLRKENTKKRGNLQRKALFTQSKQNEKHLKLNLSENVSSNDSCQITGVTLDNTHGFQMSFENLQDAKAVTEHQYLTILVVELHIRTRGEMYPDPQYDSVRAIFYSILNDVPGDLALPREETGAIVVDTLPGSPIKDKRKPILEGTGVKCKINYVKSEIELIDEFIKLIRKWDPDIFVGFEIEMLSWGYLIERCNVIGINLPIQISRINPAILKNKANENKRESEQELKLTGRIILDAWRLFRHEIALQSYTFENLMYHILHQRVPAHSFKNLSFCWEYRSNYFRHITANYYITRVEGILKLLDQLDLIGRTSELARLFGIQFYEVLSRGSQFRVESMMLRLAKPLNYIPISPSVQQRAKMRAPEWIPLILEPESRFYTDPLIVLDFQSLYPSIIIAYNYCFSTCIGRVEQLGSNIPFDFGACQLKIKRSCVQKLQDKINFSPCGVGFVKPEVRQGILPRMLKEILETRLMVKKSMKENKGNKVLQRVLHSRQLGLKLIANVTYGYTSANFSGRMPCIEVGDSVVSKGRETLERAIQIIEKTDKWQARVVYGDTDSLFVSVPGRSREESFKIGAEIAEAVTNDNPLPIKLKLEKVYHPSLLQTKKRYVGYMYEFPEQKEPEYNAKGIETVRRDGCPAVAKMLEKTLRLLFETRDMSLVKRYVCRQFEKILTGRASIQDLVFAREFRGSSGYRPGACVPALELARKWTVTDKRREPRRGERVPYIVVHGPPGVPLIRLVRSPRELLNQEQNSSLKPNAIYYITKVIAPPLNRCLSLIGADVQVWFNEMPRKQLQILPTDVHFEKSKKSTISQYFATMNCVVCSNQTRDGLCEDCCNNPQQTYVQLQEKLRQWEISFEDVKQICESCCGRVQYTDCVSLDCPVLYRLNQTKRDLKQVPFVRNLLKNFDSEN